MTLEGEVAVVTGATRGTGRAMAAQLVDAGARVVLVGRSTNDQPHQLLPGTLEEVEVDLKGRGGDVLTVRADLSKLDQAVQVVDRTLAWADRCDILIANASYTPKGSFFEVPISRWAIGMNITLLSAVALLQGFLPGMLERAHGRFLAISSTQAAYATDLPEGWTPRPEGYGPPLLYATSKAALERFVRGMHSDYAGRGVTFTNLRAGQITSESWHLMSGQMGYSQDTTHLYNPDEIAAAALWQLREATRTDGLILGYDELLELGALAPK